MLRRARPWFRRGRKMWYVQVNGKQIGLGITDPNDVAGANAAHERLASRGFTAPESNRTATVAECIAAYLATASRRCAAGKIKPKSLTNYRLHLAHFSKEFGSRPIDQVSSDEIELWADCSPWSNSTQHNTLGTVQQMFRFAKHPIKLCRPPKESLGPESVLSDAQFADVLREVNRYLPGAKGDLANLLRVLRETGARPGEISQLTAAMIDWPNCCTTLKQHKTSKKTGVGRLIVFDAAAMRILETQRAMHPTGLLFRGRRGGHYDANTIGKRLGYRVMAYGLGRHSYVTKALIAGIPEAVVASLVGHSSTRMLSNYSHVNSASRTLRDAAEKVSRAAG